jgi:hypothetical protein
MNKLALALFASLMLVAPACHKKDKKATMPKEHKTEMKKEKKAKTSKKDKKVVVAYQRDAQGNRIHHHIRQNRHHKRCHDCHKNA